MPTATFKAHAPKYMRAKLSSCALDFACSTALCKSLFAKASAPRKKFFVYESKAEALLPCHALGAGVKEQPVTRRSVARRVESFMEVLPRLENYLAK